MSVQDDLRRAAEQATAAVEGFKVEVVGDRVIMTPQSEIQSWTILDVQVAARAAGVDTARLLSDVLVHFPGEPPRAPDVAILENGATAPYAYEDLLAAVEIVSSKDDDNDYSIKLQQYARFGVPLYLIIDPFQATCAVLTDPEGARYAARQDYAYGEMVTLHLADGSTVQIPTDTFKRKG
ncbi:Uma2 family endonuclease [Streptomyces sp. NPDC096153]|uniref:Uma2 family endonuclease n=1 Tax=Streptomyces sp. NPDC096153 TaxID=3155548 RepID=UPI003330656C